MTERIKSSRSPERFDFYAFPSSYASIIACLDARRRLQRQSAMGRDSAKRGDVAGFGQQHHFEAARIVEVCRAASF
jgi:hypothetical protein